MLNPMTRRSWADDDTPRAANPPAFLRGNLYLNAGTPAQVRTDPRTDAPTMNRRSNMTEHADSAYVWYDADGQVYIVNTDEDGDGDFLAQAFPGNPTIGAHRFALADAVSIAEGQGFLVENYDPELGCIERKDHVRIEHCTPARYYDPELMYHRDGSPVIFTAQNERTGLEARAQYAVTLLIGDEWGTLADDVRGHWTQ